MGKDNAGRSAPLQSGDRAGVPGRATGVSESGERMGKATYLLRKASELVREKRYQDAVEVYLRATETAPTDSRAWFGLGVCLFRVGNLDVARIALERARHMGYPRAEEALARVESAERRRQAEGSGAKPTVAPAEAARRAAQKSAAVGPPPRPTVRPEEEKIELVRPLRVMLVEEDEAERQAIIRSIQGALKEVDVVSVPYGVSTSETMSGTVHYDAAVLDWDRSPDATAGLIQILKIKRPTLFVICLTEEWDPETAVEILEAGADYHLVKGPHFASALPLILAQWTDRDYAVAEEQSQYVERRSDQGSSVLASIGEMMLVVDATGTITEANPAAMRGLNRGQEQLLGQSCSDVLHGREEPPESCPVSAVLERDEPASGTIVPPGNGRTFEVHAWPLRGAGDRTQGAVVMLREKEEAEVEPPGAGLVEEAARLAAILDEGVGRLACGAVVLDDEGCVTWANALAADLFGLTPDQLVGRDYLGLLRETLSQRLDRPEDFLAAVTEAHTRDEALEDMPFRVAGEALRYWSTPAQTDSPSVRRVEHFYLALEPAPASAALVEGLTALTQVVDALPDMLFTTDAEGRIDWCNATGSTLSGRPRDSLIGMPLVDLCAGQDRMRVEQLLGDVLEQGGRVERQELMVARPDGRRVWVELTLLPRGADESGTARGAEGVLRDVTDRKVNRAIRAILAGEQPPAPGDGPA